MITYAWNRASVTVVACAFALLACNGQRTSPTPMDAPEATHLPLAADTPHVEVRVDKEYDEAGNLLRFDSTYVSIWSGGPAGQLAPDSLLGGSFHPYLNGSFPGFQDLLPPMFMDTLSQPGLRDPFEWHRREMERMMRDMEQMRGIWYHDRMKPPTEDPTTRTI